MAQIFTTTFYNIGNNGNIVWISGIGVLRVLLHSDGRDYGPADSLGKEKACIARSYLNFSSELYDQLHTLLHHVKTVQTDLQVRRQFFLVNIYKTLCFVL